MNPLNGVFLACKYKLKVRNKGSRLINPFHTIGIFLNPLKTSENLFLDVFRGYRMHLAT